MRRFSTLRVLSMALVLLALLALLAWLLPRLRPARGNLYHFYVEDTAGLPEGTEVKFRGLVVGQVMRVGLDEEKSRADRAPWFRVDFQANDEGTRVMNLWSFRQVALDKEVPVIGATVVTLTDPSLPGGQTPVAEALAVRKAGDDTLPGPLVDLANHTNELVVNANSAVESLRGSLGMPPDSLGDDRHANLALCLQRDVYPLTEAGVDTARPTRLAATLENVGVLAARFQAVGEHLSAITDEDGSMNRAVRQVAALASNLQDENKPFLRVFTDLKKTSGELRGDFAEVNALLARIAPMIERGTSNAEQMTDTLKREPWRVVWRSTKTYDPAAPTPTSSPRRLPLPGGHSPAHERPAPTPR